VEDTQVVALAAVAARAGKTKSSNSNELLFLTFKLYNKEKEE